jgi:hypothetical protein
LCSYFNPCLIEHDYGIVNGLDPSKFAYHISVSPSFAFPSDMECTSYLFSGIRHFFCFLHLCTVPPIYLQVDPLDGLDVQRALRISSQVPRLQATSLCLQEALHGIFESLHIQEAIQVLEFLIQGFP